MTFCKSSKIICKTA